MQSEVVVFHLTWFMSWFIVGLGCDSQGTESGGPPIGPVPLEEFCDMFAEFRCDSHTACCTSSERQYSSTSACLMAESTACLEGLLNSFSCTQNVNLSDSTSQQIIEALANVPNAKYDATIAGQVLEQLRDKVSTCEPTAARYPPTSELFVNIELETTKQTVGSINEGYCEYNSVSKKCPDGLTTRRPDRNQRSAARKPSECAHIEDCLTCESSLYCQAGSCDTAEDCSIIDDAYAGCLYGTCITMVPRCREDSDACQPIELECADPALIGDPCELLTDCATGLFCIHGECTELPQSIGYCRRDLAPIWQLSIQYSK